MFSYGLYLIVSICISNVLHWRINKEKNGEILVTRLLLLKNTYFPYFLNAETV